MLAEVRAQIRRMEERALRKLLEGGSMPPEPKPVDMEHVHRELDQGKSVAVVAKELGCARTTLQSRLARERNGHQPDIERVVDEAWRELPLAERVKMLVHRLR